MKKRKNGMTSKGVIKCREQFDSLLAQGRQVTSDTTEHCHPNFRKEKGGGLLLTRDHAQISLRLVVVKWDSKIEQEPHYSPFALEEPIKQIASRTVLRNGTGKVLRSASIVSSEVLFSDIARVFTQRVVPCL